MQQVNTGKLNITDVVHNFKNRNLTVYVERDMHTHIVCALHIAST